MWPRHRVVCGSRLWNFNRVRGPLVTLSDLFPYVVLCSALWTTLAFLLCMHLVTAYRGWITLATCTRLSPPSRFWQSGGRGKIWTPPPFMLGSDAEAALKYQFVPIAPSNACAPSMDLNGPSSPQVKFIHTVLLDLTSPTQAKIHHSMECLTNQLDWYQSFKIFLIICTGTRIQFINTS